MYVVKLAVCLVLVGGVSRKDVNGSRVRGESHLLLAGDPGNIYFKLFGINSNFKKRLCP